MTFSLSKKFFIAKIILAILLFSLSLFFINREIKAGHSVGVCTLHITQPTPGNLQMELGVSCPVTYYPIPDTGQGILEYKYIVEISTEEEYPWGGYTGNPGTLIFTEEVDPTINGTYKDDFQLYFPGRYVAEAYQLGDEKTLMDTFYFEVTNDVLNIKPSPPPTQGNQSFAQFLCKEGADIGVKTSFGCFLITSTESQIANVIKLAFALAGGIAFLLIAISAFMMMTSQGDPQRMQAASGLLTSAVTGLVFIALCILILRIIGVNVLGLF